MYINQLAKAQMLTYQFISNHSDYASPWQTQFQNSAGVGRDTKSGSEVDPDSLLQQMGVSGLKGRTVREMVKYRMEQAQEKAEAAQQLDTVPDIDLSALKQQLAQRTLTTPLSDAATRDMQSLALQDAMNSVKGAASSDAASNAASSSTDRAALIQDHLKLVSPTKRLAAFNTMNKVWQSELDRIGSYIQEQDPSWKTWGDDFDTSILKNYTPGINIWT